MQKKLLAILPILVIAASLFTAMILMTSSGQSGQPQQTTGQVYTIDNAAANNVWIFNRAADGTLKVSTSVSTHGNGTGAGLASQGAVILSPDNKWLLVVDAGSNEITSFQVNGSNLIFADKESSHGWAPTSITMAGNWVYVLNNGTATVPGNIAGFQINQTGMLTYIPGSNKTLSGMPNTSPEQIGFNPNGTVLLVTEKAANLTDWYTITNGVASNPIVAPSVSAGPYGFAYTTSGFLVLSEAVTNTLTSYWVNANASVRVLSGSMPTFGNAPCWVAVTQDGRYAYTSNAHGGTISGFTISVTGQLNLFSSIAAKTAVPALDLALSTGGQFLYAVNGNAITGYAVWPDGSLTTVTNVPGLPMSITGLAAT